MNQVFSLENQVLEFKYNLQRRPPKCLKYETVLAARERLTNRRGCYSPFIRAELHLTYRNTTWAKLAILKRDMEDAQHICKYQALGYIAHVTTICRNSPLHCFAGDKISRPVFIRVKIKHVMVYENIRKSIFCGQSFFFQKVCL
jgi:hypothetical protein